MSITNGTAFPNPASLGVLPGTTQQVDPSSAWPIAGSAGAALGTGTGQFGIVPQAGGSLMGGSFWENFWNWLNAPLTQTISAYHIFLLIGAILIGWFLWGMIFYHIRIAAESV